MPEQTTKHTLTEQQAENILTGDPISSGYKPSLPISQMWHADGTPYLYVLRDIEPMLLHPAVLLPLNYYKAGIAGMEVEFKASSSQVGEYALAEWKRFFQRSRYQVQRSYEYGWGGYEVMYAEEKGHLCFDMLYDFSPRDSFVLTQKYHYLGVRIKNVHNRGPVDLWGPGVPPGVWERQADEAQPFWDPEVKRKPGEQRAAEVWQSQPNLNLPAKGFWFAHDKRWHLWYGRTQCLGSWRPWRRLAGQDGAEHVIDHGVYRYAFRGPMVRYPVQDVQPRPAAYPQYSQSSGNQPITARDKARELAEMAKAGVSVAFPSTRDDKGNLVWDMDWPANVLDVGPLIKYQKELEQQCAKGIGIPPELMEASETGSGYSGRMIPMEGFFVGQQMNAERMFEAWKSQIGDPLVRWNFGPEAWFEGEIKPLLATKAMQSQGQDSGPQGQQQGQPGPGNPLMQMLQQKGVKGGPAQLATLIPFARKYRQLRRAA